jgi:hypothetical protein
MQGDCITPEHVFETLEEDLQVSTLCACVCVCVLCVCMCVYVCVCVFLCVQNAEYNRGCIAGPIACGASWLVCVMASVLWPLCYALCVMASVLWPLCYASVLWPPTV